MPVVTDRFTRAIEYAATATTAASRPGGDLDDGVPLPSLVFDYGGDEEQAIAGLLHDVVEDQGHGHLAVVREQFGDRVARIVMACTDATQEDKAAALTPEQQRANWTVRKQRYIERLATEHDEVLLVSGCDKLHNVRAILSDLRVPAVGMARRRSRHTPAPRFLSFPIWIQQRRLRPLEPPVPPERCVDRHQVCALVGRFAVLDQMEDVGQYRSFLGEVAVAYEAGIDEARVDGLDAGQDDDAAAGVAGARVAVHGLGREQSFVPRGGIQRDRAAGRDECGCDVALEHVRVDVRCGEDDFLEPRADVGLLGQERGDGARERPVAHAVGDQVDGLRIRVREEVVEEVVQVGLRPFGVLFVDRVGGGLALRGPAVEHRRAVEAEVVRHLRGASCRVGERNVVAVHEQERALARRGAYAGGDVVEELLPGVEQRAQQHDVFFRVFVKLQAPDRRPFDLAHAVIARNANVTGAVADIGTVVAEHRRGVGGAGQRAVGCEERPDHCVVGLLALDRRRRRPGLVRLGFGLLPGAAEQQREERQQPECARRRHPCLPASNRDLSATAGGYCRLAGIAEAERRIHRHSAGTAAVSRPRAALRRRGWVGGAVSFREKPAQRARFGMRRVSRRWIPAFAGMTKWRA